MTANVGTLDRVLRALLGAVLLLAGIGGALETVAAPYGTYVAIIIGVVLLATATLRFCPLYRILGIRTCRV